MVWVNSYIKIFACRHCRRFSYYHSSTFFFQNRWAKNGTFYKSNSDRQTRWQYSNIFDVYAATIYEITKIYLKNHVLIKIQIKIYHSEQIWICIFMTKTMDFGSSKGDEKMKTKKIKKTENIYSLPYMTVKLF